MGSGPISLMLMFRWANPAPQPLPSPSVNLLKQPPVTPRDGIFRHFQLRGLGEAMRVEGQCFSVVEGGEPRAGNALYTGR